MGEIDALISLLQDDSPTVLDAVRRRLLELRGISRQPLVAAARSDDVGVRERAREILAEMDRSQVFERLIRFAEVPAPDLEKGVILLAEVHTPSLDTVALTRSLDGLAEAIRPRLEAIPAGREQIAAFLRYVHEELELSGDTEDFYAFENNFLHLVLERRLGIPITLIAVYVLLGRRLGLSIDVVGAPYRALAEYTGGDYKTYIDAFAGGDLCTRQECLDFLHRHGFVGGNGDRFLRILTDSEILERMAHNIIRYCDGNGRDEEGHSFRHFARVLTESRTKDHLARDARS